MVGGGLLGLWEAACFLGKSSHSGQAYDQLRLVRTHLTPESVEHWDLVLYLGAQVLSDSCACVRVYLCLP